MGTKLQNLNSNYFLPRMIYHSKYLQHNQQLICRWIGNAGCLEIIRHNLGHNLSKTSIIIQFTREKQELTRYVNSTPSSEVTLITAAVKVAAVETNRKYSHSKPADLTHWDQDKMAAFLQTTFSNAFFLMKMDALWLIFHWSLFLRAQLTIFYHWFRSWLGAVQATSHYRNHW